MRYTFNIHSTSVISRGLEPRHPNTRRREGFLTLSSQGLEFRTSAPERPPPPPSGSFPKLGTSVSPQKFLFSDGLGTMSMWVRARGQTKKPEDGCKGVGQRGRPPRRPQPSSLRGNGGRGGAGLAGVRPGWAG